MRTILPGKPQAKLQAVCTAQWEGLRLVVSDYCISATNRALLMIGFYKVYISGNGIVILGGPHDLIQTIYHDEQSELEAVAIDEATGKIATCTSKEVMIYNPYGREEGALKVLQTSTVTHLP